LTLALITHHGIDFRGNSIQRSGNAEIEKTLYSKNAWNLRCGY